MMKKSALIKALKRMVVEAGSKQQVADDLGVSAQYLSDVLTGRRNPGPKILAAFNLMAVTVYVTKPLTPEERARGK